MGKRVHFQNLRVNRPACRSVVGPHPLLTRNVKEVTCYRCIDSGTYRAALRTLVEREKDRWPKVARMSSSFSLVRNRIGEYRLHVRTRSLEPDEVQVLTDLLLVTIPAYLESPPLEPEEVDSEE